MSVWMGQGFFTAKFLKIAKALRPTDFTDENFLVSQVRPYSTTDCTEMWPLTLQTASTSLKFKVLKFGPSLKLGPTFTPEKKLFFFLLQRHPESVVGSLFERSKRQIWAR